MQTGRAALRGSGFDQVGKDPDRKTHRFLPRLLSRLVTSVARRLKKMGEEAAELGVACADADRALSAEEAADLIYHAVVARRGLEASLGEVKKVLVDGSTAREGAS